MGNLLVPPLCGGNVSFAALRRVSCITSRTRRRAARGTFPRGAGKRERRCPTIEDCAPALEIHQKTAAAIGNSLYSLTGSASAFLFWARIREQQYGISILPFLARCVMDPLKTVKDLNPTKKVLSLWDEFKGFAFKGNMIDLAVAVVIGTAFAKVIDSLVKNVFMPVIGLIMPGEKGYEGWVWHVGDQRVPYGLFIGEVINFLIVALIMFLFIVKFLGWLMKMKKEAPQATLTKDQELLTEIRDLLKNKEAQDKVPEQA